jgi:hypothetical protein
MTLLYSASPHSGRDTVGYLTVDEFSLADMDSAPLIFYYSDHSLGYVPRGSLVDCVGNWMVLGSLLDVHQVKEIKIT